MDDKPRKSKPNVGSLISLVIFVVFVAGRPLANLIRQWLNGGLTFSWNVISLPWLGLLPLAGGVLALLVGAVIIARVLGSGASGAPMQWPSSLPGYEDQLPRSPRFEPLINPLLLIAGIVGLLGLGVIGFLLFQLGI